MGSQSELRDKLTVTELANRDQITPVAQVQQMLLGRKNQIAQVLPKVLTSERLSHLTINAVRETPKLLQCTEASLIGGVLQCAMLGLEPNTFLQHAFLIPFYNSGRRVYEAQFIAGYRGLLELARRSGKVTKVQANVVREGDKFFYEFGFEETLRHIPADEYDEAAPITHAYAYARLASGDMQFAVMTYGQIMSIRNRSQGYLWAVKRADEINAKRVQRAQDPIEPDTPWIKYEAAMCAKTAIRNLYKTLPSSPEMARVEMLDSQADRGVPQSLEAILEGEGTRISTDRGEGSGSEFGEDGEDPAGSSPPVQTFPVDNLRNGEREMLERLGFAEIKFEDGSKGFVNADGELFNAEWHQSQDDGSPALNADGAFVRKGQSAPTKEEE